VTHRDLAKKKRPRERDKRKKRQTYPTDQEKEREKRNVLRHLEEETIKQKKIS
jgi:hypothetical protein